MFVQLYNTGAGGWIGARGENNNRRIVTSYQFPLKFRGGRRSGWKRALAGTSG